MRVAHLRRYPVPSTQGEMLDSMDLGGDLGILRTLTRNRSAEPGVHPRVSVPRRIDAGDDVFAA